MSQCGGGRGAGDEVVVRFDCQRRVGCSDQMDAVHSVCLLPGRLFLSHGVVVVVHVMTVRCLVVACVLLRVRVGNLLAVE